MHTLPLPARGLLRSVAHSKTANWYVRQHAAVSIGWFLLDTEARQLLNVLFTEWDDEVRRAIVTLCFASPPTEDALLQKAARDLSPKVSRMANYLLALQADAALARFNLKKFSHPNKIFFVDSYWRLYQIARNRDPIVAEAVSSCP